MKEPGEPVPVVGLDRALRGIRALRAIADAEAAKEITPAMGSLLRRMSMAPGDVGREAKVLKRQRNSQPHASTREMERRRRQLERKAPRG